VSDKFFSNVEVLLGFNGSDGSTTFTDDSGTPKTFSASGNAQLDTARSKWGSAGLLLDGTGDWISASAAALNLNSEIYTIECWAYYDQVNYDTGGQSARCLFSNWVQQSNGRVVISVGSNGSININEQAANGTSSHIAASAINAFPLQQWVHVAVTRDLTSSSGTLRVFLNGVIVASVTGVAARSDYGNNCKVGAFAAGGGFDNTWKGSMDDFRLTKGLCRYTSNFTSPRGPYNRSKTFGVFGEYSQPVISVAR
jgi:hypothetical protein